MRVSTIIAAAVAFLGTSLAGAGETAAPTASAPQLGPSELVQAVAGDMLKDLDANRTAYRQDPSKVNDLVEKHLLPHFDTQFAAQRVLARHWRTATPDQRKRFIDAFYHSLLRNYGTALAEFTGDKLKVYPLKVAAGVNDATVRTDVKRSNGTRVPVNYRLHLTPEGWKAWDVVIEGISYVKSFQEDFGAEIEQRGLDAVIERMEKGGRPAKAA